MSIWVPGQSLRGPLGGERTSDGSNITINVGSTSQRSFRIETDIAHDDANPHEINIYANGDTTDANYSTGQIWQSGGTVITDNTARPIWGWVSATADSSVCGLVQVSPGGWFSFTSWRSSDLGAASATQSLRNGYKSAALGAELTSITIKGLPSGSKVRVYPGTY